MIFPDKTRDQPPGPKLRLDELAAGGLEFRFGSRICAGMSDSPGPCSSKVQAHPPVGRQQVPHYTHIDANVVTSGPESQDKGAGSSSDDDEDTSSPSYASGSSSRYGPRTIPMSQLDAMDLANVMSKIPFV